jgi:hypothetical protein
MVVNYPESESKAITDKDNNTNMISKSGFKTTKNARQAEQVFMDAHLTINL